MRSDLSSAILAIVLLIAGGSVVKGDPIGSGSSNSLGNLFYGGSTQSVAAAPAWLTGAFASGGSSSAAASSPATSSASMNQAAPATSGPTYDAFINFGTGGFAEAAALTGGNPQSWAYSPVAEKFFGGVPTYAQQAQFDATVLQRVQSTYNQSGIPISLTDSPNANATHMLSVVSNAASNIDPNAIGMTDTGNNGFSFIDKFGYATSLDQLEWAVAHNIAHELMHAFGLGFHPDQTGTYLDAGTATWSLLTDPNTKFSPAATSDLVGLNFQLPGGGLDSGNGLQTLSPGFEKLDGLDLASPNVPEPATIALWASAAGLAALARGRRSRSPKVLS